jgi:hypothetical protein
VSTGQKILVDKTTPKYKLDASGNIFKGPPITDTQTKEWTTAGWVGSLDFASLVVAALEPAVPAGCKALEYFRETASRNELDSRLRAAQLAGFSDLVWAAVERLRTERTAAEVQEKFLTDGMGLLEYSDLSTFFGGLEAKVGAPNPKIVDAMAAEHTERDDSNVELVSSNHHVKTTSAIEWRFVVEPDRPPPEGWPAEAKLLAAKFRAPMPIADMELRLTERNARLRKIKEPSLILAEGFGARLYTGPLFTKVGLPTARTTPFPHNPAFSSVAERCPEALWFGSTLSLVPHSTMASCAASIAACRFSELSSRYCAWATSTPRRCMRSTRR